MTDHDPEQPPAERPRAHVPGPTSYDRRQRDDATSLLLGGVVVIVLLVVLVRQGLF